MVEIIKTEMFDCWLAGLRDRRGYRVYFLQRGPVVVVLLDGGDKSTQEKDIERAQVIAKEWRG